MYFFPLCTPKKFCPVWLTVLFITSARGLHGQFSSNMTNTNTPNPTLIESLHSVERKFLISFKVTLSPLKHGKGHHSPPLFFTPDVAFFVLARPVSSLLPSPSALPPNFQWPALTGGGAPQHLHSLGACRVTVQPARLQEACTYWTWTRAMVERIISLLNTCQISLVEHLS